MLHDENDNGRLDADAMGMPIEGYGFSNNVHGFLSAPSFDAAAVTIGDADESIAISLTYPLPVSPEDQSDYDRFNGPAPNK